MDSPCRRILVGGLLLGAIAVAVAVGIGGRDPAEETLSNQRKRMGEK